MNVLVTGGAGYIGSHCAKALSRSGFQPIVLDNLSRGHRELVKFGPLIQGECQDQLLVETILEEFEIEAVFHLAGYCYVEESVREPQKYQSNNVDSLRSVIEAMTNKGVHQLIFSSTCTIYGNSPVPVSESAPFNPGSPYAKSKVHCEKLLEKYHQLNTIILRFFNVAGADPDEEIGEIHEPETHILPLMIQAALDGRSDFKIYGSDYSTEDGTCVRDYVHVADIAKAHILGLKQLLAGGQSVSYNLCQERGYSNLELAKEVQKVLHVPFSFQLSSRRAGDEASLVGCSEKARKQLGWVPSSSSLSQIVNSAVKWELNRRQVKNTIATRSAEVVDSLVK